MFENIQIFFTPLRELFEANDSYLVSCESYLAGGIFRYKLPKLTDFFSHELGRIWFDGDCGFG